LDCKTRNLGDSNLNFLLDERFILFVDAPVELVGGEILRVNSLANSLELVAPRDIPGIAEIFLDLSDTPSEYDGKSEFLIRVKGDESGLEFVRLEDVVNVVDGEPTLLGNFLDLTDTPNTYFGENGKFLRVVGDKIEFENLKFLGLGDTPNSFGSPGSLLVVDGSENGISFVTRSLDFLGLSDTPNQYTSNDGLRVIKVKEDLSGVEFSDYNFLSLEDTPNSFSGEAGKFLRVNQDSNQIIFDSETFTNFISLLDTPNEYGVEDGGKFLTVENIQEPEKIIFKSAAEISATAQNFLSLTDTTNSYSGQLGRFARVSPTPDGRIILTFADIETLSSDVAQADLNLYDEEYVGGNRPSAIGENSVSIGEDNSASGTNSSIVGGKGNSAEGQFSTIIGGFSNVMKNGGVIIGGQLNFSDVGESTSLIGGGQQNTIEFAGDSIIGTGLRNTITGEESVNCIIGGGLDNRIDIVNFYEGEKIGSTICGGQRNIISGDGSVILAGYFNTVSSPFSVVVSSQAGFDISQNRPAISGDYSVVLGPQAVTDRGWFGARPFANESSNWRFAFTRNREPFFGEIQSTTLLFSGDTNDGNWKKLLLDSDINYGNRRDVEGGYLSRITLPNLNGVYWIEAEIVARDKNLAHSANFSLRSIVMVNEGNISLPSGFEKTSVCKCGPGSSVWDAKISVEGGLIVNVEVKGRDDQDIRWLCKVNTIELMIVTDSSSDFTVTPVNDFQDGGFTVEENFFGAPIALIERDGGLEGLSFSVVPTQFEVTSDGIFKLRDTNRLNFEAASFVTAIVYINSQDKSGYITIPITVLDVNEPPTQIILTDISTGSTTVRTVPAGVPGARIAFVTVNDPDDDEHILEVFTNQTFFEIIKENINGVFRDVLKLRDGVSTNINRSLQIRATDPGGLSGTQGFQIQVRVI
jgi:hypothetical protein